MLIGGTKNWFLISLFAFLYLLRLNSFSYNSLCALKKTPMPLMNSLFMFFAYLGFLFLYFTKYVNIYIPMSIYIMVMPCSTYEILHYFKIEERTTFKSRDVNIRENSNTPHKKMLNHLKKFVWVVFWNPPFISDVGYAKWSSI